MIELIKKDLKEAQKTLDLFLKEELNLEAIERAVLLMVEALKNGNKIISCGNGGSMCDVEIRAPESIYADRVQEIHTKIIHVMMNAIEHSMGLEKNHDQNKIH